MTPKSAWEAIAHLLPRDRVLWESFYGDGKSGQYLRELGFEVIHENVDFFEHDMGDVVVSNPPFSNWMPIVKRLVDMKKPFVLIMPSSRLFTAKFQSLFGDDLKELQIAIPRRRIQFTRSPPPKHNRCNFDCAYYFFRIELSERLVLLS